MVKGMSQPNRLSVVARRETRNRTLLRRLYRAKALVTIKLIKVYKSKMKTSDSYEIRKPASVVLQIPKNCLQFVKEPYS